MDGKRRFWPLGSGTNDGGSFWQGRGRLVFVGAAAAFYFGVAPHWPTEQHLRLELGDNARTTTEVVVRCRTPDAAEAGDARQVTFHYAKGQAPRIVSYEPRLVSGDYVVEIEITFDDSHDPPDSHMAMTRRRLKLDGNATTTIDLSGERGS
jgi:hypothetical protein